MSPLCLICPIILVFTQLSRVLLGRQFLKTLPDKLLHSHPDNVSPIPQGHEGDAEEKTEGSSELGDKRRPRVDQQFRLHKSVVGHRVEAEQEVFGFVRSWQSVSLYLVLHVVAGLQTSSPPINSVQVFNPEFVVKFLIYPANRNKNWSTLKSLPNLYSPFYFTYHKFI